MPQHELNQVTKVSSADNITVDDQRQDLRDRDVYDRDGDQIGSVEDLYVDPEGQHEVRFLDLGSGGFLGLGEKHFLVPIEAVREANEDRVTIAEDQEKVKNAPDVPLDPVITPDDQRRLYDYYGV